MRERKKERERKRQRENNTDRESECHLCSIHSRGMYPTVEEDKLLRHKLLVVDKNRQFHLRRIWKSQTESTNSETFTSRK